MFTWLINTRNEIQQSVSCCCFHLPVCFFADELLVALFPHADMYISTIHVTRTTTERCALWDQSLEEGVTNSDLGVRKKVHRRGGILDWVLKDKERMSQSIDI